MRKKDEKSISFFRINILFFIVFILFATIIIRLAYIQLVQGDMYRAMAASNQIKMIPFTAPRGLIKDTNNVVLVSNKTVWTVTFQVDEFREQDFDKIATVLANVLTKAGSNKLEEKKDILKNMQTGPKYIPKVIKVDIDDKTRAYLEEHKSELPGVEVIPDQMRSYNYGNFMAQVIGYMRSIKEDQLAYYQALGYKMTDRIGMYGLEKEYENILHGTDGHYEVEVNSDYATVKQMKFSQPIPGNNIILTVDQRFQETVEKILETHVEALRNRKINPMKNVDKATAVVLDPNTGAVLAMGNYPRFDPNWYNGTISQELYQNYIMPFEANLAIRGRYPAGSTVKPLTVLMGLQEEVISRNTIINDKGALLYDKDPRGNPLYMRNYGNHAYGKLTLQKALQKSSNVFMATVALGMKEKYGLYKTMDLMRYYDKMFGLGEKTGIDLPEELPGRISPDPYFVNHSIGQHDTFTAMQLAQYVSTIANDGYRMKPYLVRAIEEGTVNGTTGKVLFKHEPEVLNKVDILPDHMKAVQEGMYMVTQPGGTAYYAFKDLPIQVAAKTGTAQSGYDDDHAVLIGYAPYHNPKIAFAVIVPFGGGGGSTAGPIAKEIVEAYVNLYGLN